MSETLAVLNELRRRPGMYIGSPSVIRLAAFLHGYDYALWKLDGRALDPLLADFRDWIQRRFQTTSVGWEDLIVRHSKNEDDAWKRLWDLFDEFQAERSVGANGPTTSAITTEKEPHP
jgi:hypothetical protein